MAIRDAEQTAAMRVTRSNAQSSTGKKRGRSDSEEPASSRKRSRRGDPERAGRGKKKGKGNVQGTAGEGRPRVRPYMRASKRQRLMDEWRNQKGQFLSGDDDMPTRPYVTSVWIGIVAIFREDLVCSCLSVMQGPPVSCSKTSQQEEEDPQQEEEDPQKEGRQGEGRFDGLMLTQGLI